jgi:serine phosphatase RsbU (regulator of sigma subunit)
MQYEFQRIQYKDSLKRAEQAKRLALEQKQKDLEKEAEIERQRVYTVAGGVGFMLMLGLAFVLFRGYKNKQKANEIIFAQKEEVELQKELAEQQKSIVEEKNHEIVDSINYAKRIQNTILPSNEQIKKLLPDSFVIFKPKDIVSGDFYWCDEKDDYVFFSAVDCTGHGVPGALVSVVGHNGLNRAIHEYGLTEPAEILNKLNEIVKQTFSHTSDSIKDGMDLALCRLDKKKMELQYAGANNPLYIIRQSKDPTLENLSDRLMELENQDAVLYEIKADKQPIGSYEYSKPFTNQVIKLSQNDTIYVFSDGFADQFGGMKGKKFMYKPFKRLLLTLFGAKMDQQKIDLDHAFNEWKGEMEQIDDVCIMGIKIA